MKKIILVCLAMFIIFGLVACGNSATKKNGNLQGNSQKQNLETAESETTEGTTIENADSTEASAETETSAEMQPTDTSRILVAYFSATGTTKGVAETLANGLGADIYEITPVEPYTDADLDYTDNNSRSTVEMNDSSARPEIAGSVENMDDYDIVFLGYPIWWSDAPRIMSTFVESYDFSDKTVIPFCTSGGSGIGASGSNLEALTDGATWLSGTRLSGGASWDTIKEWVDGLGIAY